MMTLKTISFKELERYHKEIPMLKEGTKKLLFKDNKTIELVDTEPYKIDMTKEEKVSLWKEILNPNNTQVLVLEDKGQFLAGTITVAHSPKCNMLKGDMSNAVLWDIRVNPSYQNQGFASILLKESLLFAKKKKCKRLLIETQDNNEKAIPFYLKHGATLLETNKDAYPAQYNEWQYILEIKI